jgi:hypothetical protein
MMRLVRLIIILPILILSTVATAQAMSEAGLANVLAEFSDFCVEESKRQGMSDPDSSDVILSPSALSNYVVRDDLVSVLRAAGMHCHSVGYAFCGVGGNCTEWIFYNGKSQYFNGSIVTQELDGGLSFFLCDLPNSDLETCRKIELDLFK